MKYYYSSVCIEWAVMNAEKTQILCKDKEFVGVCVALPEPLDESDIICNSLALAFVKTKHAVFGTVLNYIEISKIAYEKMKKNYYFHDFSEPLPEQKELIKTLIGE